MRHSGSELNAFFTLSRMASALFCVTLPSATLAADGIPKPEKIVIWTGQAPTGDGEFENTNVWITVHRPAHPNGTAIIICPGGGYSGLVRGPEGHGIATWLNRYGITGIVLEYRMPNGRPFVPLLDAQRAIRTVRSKATEWHLKPNRIGILGFSAGGHVASTAATHFDRGNPSAVDPVNRVSGRPDFAILIYPVITMGEKTHPGSKHNLIGENPTAKRVHYFSNETQVTDQTPPTFLAQAQDDTAVSPENSRMFFEALQAHHIPSQYLELPYGNHGLNHYQGPMWDEWQTKTLVWLKTQNFIPIVGFDPANTDSAGGAISVTNRAVLNGLSPYNWVCKDDSISTTVCGASITMGFTETKKVALRVDTKHPKTTPMCPARYPVIAWSIDGGTIQSHQLAYGEKSVLLCSNAANPIIDLYIKGMSPFENRYQGDVPNNAVKILGFYVDLGGVAKTAPRPDKVWINVGDSIMSGDGAAYASGQGRPENDRWAESDDSRASYGYLLAQHYGYRETRIAYGGYNWAGGIAGIPGLITLIDQKTSTVKRSAGGSLHPIPDVILINLGENGVPAEKYVVDALNKIRSRVNQSTQIIVMIPVSGKGRTEITRAFNTYKNATEEARVYLVDLGKITYETCEGCHPVAAGHQAIYKAALPDFDAILLDSL